MYPPHQPGTPPPGHGGPGVPHHPVPPPPQQWAPTPPRRGRARKVLSTVGTVGAVVATFFTAMVGVAFDALRYDDPTTLQVIGSMAGFILAVGVATAVVWRAQFAVVVCLATAVAGIVSPVGALAPLIALPWVYARSEVRRILACTVATGVAVWVSFARDAMREGEAVIFSTMPLDGAERSYLVPAGYVIIGVLALATSVGAGLVRRYAGRAHEAQQAAYSESLHAAALQTQTEHLRTQTDDLRSQTDHLRTELSRQDERELIAREMHDTVAHHLSIVSLHASALEVTADDPDVGDAARSMRSSAHRALEEMRTLITSLRDGSEQYSGSAPELGDLARLLDEARDAGVDLAATVFVSGADDAPPALTRAVYRIVQEALTNIAKHAPGARAEIDVRARPAEGVRIVVRNALIVPDDGGSPGPGASPGAEGVPGSGAGIVGMRERCEALDGTFSAGVDDGKFVVHAHLPWETARG